MLKYGRRFLLFLLVTSVLSAYPTQWERTYGSANANNYGEDVQVTQDGGYIIAGYTYYDGKTDIYTIRTDANGDTLWTKTYGGSEGDYAFSVKQTFDGGYIIGGYTYSFGQGHSDMYLIKTDANGDTLWTKTYGGADYEKCYSVLQVEDSGYVLVGYTSSYGSGNGDVYLVRTDANGDTLWTKTYGGSYTDGGYSLRQTEDGGYIIVGYTESYGAGSYDVYLIKTDANGDTLWTRVYGGSRDDGGRAVRQTYDGGYIIAGWNYSVGKGNGSVYLIKTDANGDTIWTKTIGGSDDEQALDIEVTYDSGYIVVGYTKSFGAGGKDVYLLRLDPNGDSIWTRTFGGTDHDAGYAVRQIDNARYILCGYSSSEETGYSDVYLIKAEDLTIESPNGMELIKGDSTYLIKWHTVMQGYADHYRLVYSIDGGLHYPYVISDNIPAGDTSYIWNVPDINSTQCKVKIEGILSDGSVYTHDESDTIFRVDADGPVAVDLISPVSNSYFSDSTITFKWHSGVDNLSGVDHYEYMRANDSNFMVGLGVADVMDTVLTLSMGEGVYYWRVHAIDSAGNVGAWSDVYKFEIDEHVPNSPQLISPNNNTWVNNANVGFEWSEVSRWGKSPVRYIVEVDTQNTLSNPVVIDTTGNTYDTINLGVGTYYWRVRAYDLAGNQGLWSGVYSFTIEVDSPSVPVLAGPSNGGIFADSTVVFTWHSSTDASSGVDHYAVEYADNISFNNSITVDVNDTTESINLTEGMYYWRVKAYDVAGNASDWSNIWGFEIDMTAPAVPVLETPVENEWINTNNITLSWTGVSKYFKSGVRYIVEVDTSTDFSEPIITDSMENTEDSVVLTDSRYYWRVKAYDLAGNEGAWSAAGTFMVDTRAPVIADVTIVHDTSYYFGPFDVHAWVTDDNGISRVLLYYKTNIDTNWVIDTMALTGTIEYTGTIPNLGEASAITVEYYVEAYDSAQNMDKDPSSGNYSFTTDVKAMNEVPRTYVLRAGLNRNGGIEIEYGLPKNSKVEIRIYSMDGRKVKEINEGERGKGYHRIEVRSGILRKGTYIIEMKAGSNKLIRKAIVGK